jgi:histidine triad (HIT) family protein
VGLSPASAGCWLLAEMAPRRWMAPAGRTGLLLRCLLLVWAAAAAGAGSGPGGAAAEPCPYLKHTLPGLLLPSPCLYPPCQKDSDGCVCMRHQRDYCQQPVAASTDSFCAAMKDWDPSLLAWIEQCRAEAGALQAFWSCPYLEQSDHVHPTLVHGTPCRWEGCIADSDSCECLHYQNIYCSQPAAAAQDGSCAQLWHAGPQEAPSTLLAALRECPEASEFSALRALDTNTAALAAPVDGVMAAGEVIAATVIEADGEGPTAAAAAIAALQAELSSQRAALAAAVGRAEAAEAALKQAQKALEQQAAAPPRHDDDSASAELLAARRQLAALEEEHRPPPPPLVVLAGARTWVDEVVEGRSAATARYEDDFVLAFDDIHPQAPTHVLVVPKTHLPGLGATPDGHTMLLGRLMQGARRVAELAGVAHSGYRVVINEGTDGGQSVRYLHVHVLGGRALSWPPG